MPNLLAISFEGELAPSFDLTCTRASGRLPDGWGLGFYPAGEPAASVLKEPAPAAESIRGELVKAWQHLASSLFVLHIRRARWGAPSDANTQPFWRSHAGRDWLFAHSGSLERRPDPRPGTRFEAVGSTDSELLFCELLESLAERGARRIKDVDLAELAGSMWRLGALGDTTSVLTDGLDLCAFAGRSAPESGGLWLCEIRPPFERVLLGDDDLELDLTKRDVKSQKGWIVSSQPLASRTGSELSWRRVPPGGVLVIRKGAVFAEIEPARAKAQNDGAPALSVKRFVAPRPAHAPVKRFEVRHRSVYRYQTPVERSLHLFRLEPRHDVLQRLIAHELSVSVDGQMRSYEDVFGNRARRMLIEAPYSELVIDAHSEVEVLDTDPLSYRPLHQKTAIPLVWMPWQRQILEPYLLPPELPETELVELAEYAQSFVERNDYDVLDTLLDMNVTIFKEFEYRQGATSVHTTPFQAYRDRFGVCQDFANLFICLSRLLGVPARYVCGYVYAGERDNQLQSEASHAWVQVYLPEVGWKGFDPTNGVVTQTDHVRVAVGRKYLDATPTAGTLYVGGSGELLEVSVSVRQIGCDV